MKCFVYHIHDSDDLNEGYIGVTKRPEKRWKEHRRSERLGKLIEDNNLSITNMKIIFEGTEKECFEKERQLRPIPMGWNECQGGYGGEVKGLSERWKIERVGKGNPNFGLKRSDETKQRMSESIKEYYKTEEGQNHIEKYGKILSQMGAESVRDSQWWNNGIENKRSKDKPGEGWIKGRLEYDKSNIGGKVKQKRTKSVIVNGILYESTNAAAKATGHCTATIRARIKKGLYKYA